MTDRIMSPRECGDVLKVTAAFIRGEVKDGHLRARVFTRPTGRSVYRISAEDFDAYVARYWPQFSRGTIGNGDNGENAEDTGTTS